MSLIKKPSEIEPKRTITALIYGQPGIGKTTLGVSAPNAVLFDYDGGVTRINGAHQVPTLQPTKWEETFDALEEIKEELPETRTIVIDTAGKMLDMMSAYIIANDSRMQMRDGSLSLKGYGQRKQMFINFLKSITATGYNVIFIAHEKEDKQDEKVYKRPDIGGSSANDLIKELDLVGYMEAVGKERTITFDPSESHYAKNCCNLPALIKIPVVVDENGVAQGSNNYLEGVIKAYYKQQEQTIKMTAKYEELIAAIDREVSSIENIDQLNESLASLGKTNHIYNSRIVAGQKLNAKAKEIGAKYDAKIKQYRTNEYSE